MVIVFKIQTKILFLMYQSTVNDRSWMSIFRVLDFDQFDIDLKLTFYQNWIFNMKKRARWISVVLYQTRNRRCQFDYYDIYLSWSYRTISNFSSLKSKQIDLTFRTSGWIFTKYHVDIDCCQDQKLFFSAIWTVEEHLLCSCDNYEYLNSCECTV